MAASVLALAWMGCSDDQSGASPAAPGGGRDASAGASGDGGRNSAAGAGGVATGGRGTGANGATSPGGVAGAGGKGGAGGRADASVPNDGGGAAGSDAGGVDAGGRDAGHDGSAFPPPCPIGPADGCCPLLVNGGSDPDCPAIACSTLKLSQPILLEESPQTNLRMPATGMVWTGKELVLARAAAGTNPDSNWDKMDLVIEWRDLDGTFTRPSVRFPACDFCDVTNAPSTLAYEPTTRTFLFTYATSGMVTELLAFDESGTFSWRAGGPEVCNGEVARIHAMAGGGHFAVGADNYTCSLPGDRHADVRVYSPDGNELARKQLAQPAVAGAYACNTDCSEVFGYYSDYSATPHGAWLDVGSNTVAPPVTLGASLYGGIRFTAAAFDGAHYFVMSANHEQTGVSAVFQFFDTQTGSWVGSATRSPTQKGLPGEMVWSGSGFVAAAPTFPVSEQYAFPSDYTQITIQLWSLAADGTVLQAIPLEAYPGFHPKLAWAYDRIAVTWVRIPPGANQPFQRYLAFLQCAP